MSDPHERLRKVYEALKHVDMLGGMGATTAYIELNPYPYEQAQAAQAAQAAESIQGRQYAQAMAARAGVELPTKKWLARVGNIVADGDSVEEAVDAAARKATSRVMGHIADLETQIEQRRAKIAFIREFEARVR